MHACHKRHATNSDTRLLYARELYFKFKKSKIAGTKYPRGGGGGVLQIQTQSQTKKCHFPHPFSDLASKIHTRFQT